jgi:hypothetical protein
MAELEAPIKTSQKKINFTVTYARQFLEERDIEIYAGDTQLFKPLNREIWKTARLKTGYLIGDIFIDRKGTEKIYDYAKIKNLGYSIDSRKIEQRTRFMQHVQYFLMSGITGNMRDTPRDHYIEWDPFNKQARLIGPNAGRFNPWINALGKKRSGGTGRTKLYVEDYASNAHNIIEAIMRKHIDEPEKPVFVPISEVPIMISDSGDIVCLPKSQDEHTLGIFGQKGTGKTFNLCGILSRMYHMWDKNFVVLNDWNKECGTWCMPNLDKSQQVTLMKLNQIPLPLPCVYLHPHYPKIKESEIMNPEVASQISIPYEELIINFDKYMTLDKTTVYFKNLQEELLACESMEDVDALIKRRTDKKQNEKQKILDMNSAKKITAYVADTIFRNEVTEKNSGIPCSWNAKFPNGEVYSGNPITTCMVAGLIPVIETQTLSSKDYFQPYLKYFIEDIFNGQINDPILKENNTCVYFFIDELHTLSSTQQKGVVDEILKRVVREGRPRRIGMIVADQKFKQVPDEIKSQLKFIITFSNPIEANEIATTYDLGKYWQEVIKKLDKFECLAWATDEPFIVYTRNGEVIKTKGPIKGKSIPPLNMHKKPMSGNKNEV